MFQTGLRKTGNPRPLMQRAKSEEPNSQLFSILNSDFRNQPRTENRKLPEHRAESKAPNLQFPILNFIVLMGDGPNANLVKGTTFSIQVAQPEVTVQN